MDVRIRELTNAQGLPVGQRSERMDLRRSSLYVFGVHTETRAAQAVAHSFCLASVAAAACNPNDIGGAGTTSMAGSPPNDGGLWRSVYAPGGAPVAAPVRQSSHGSVGMATLTQSCIPPR